MQELRIWHITTQYDFESPQKKTHEYNENICSIFMTNEIKRHVHVYYWS